MQHYSHHAQPQIDLVHVAPATAIRGGSVGGSELKRAALEVSQIVLAVWAREASHWRSVRV